MAREDFEDVLVIARFGRHPHRNALLGREATPEVRACLAEGKLVHPRRPPREGDGA